jgi:hypothetical protein
MYEWGLGKYLNMYKGVLRKQLNTGERLDEKDVCER